MKSVLHIVCEQPSYCGVGFPNEGVVAEENYEPFCRELGIRLEKLPGGYQIGESDKDGSLIIGLKWKEGAKDIRHIVRFDRFENEKAGTFIVMDPDDSQPHTLRTFEYLKGKAVTYYRISLLGTT